MFDFNPTRKVGGYKRKAAVDRKGLRKFNKKMAAEEHLFVSDLFHVHVHEWLSFLLNQK